MKNKVFVLYVCLTYAFALHSQPHVEHAQTYKIIGWFICRSPEKTLQPLEFTDVNASKLTHIYVAFLHPQLDCSLSSAPDSNFITDISLLRAKYPHVKIFFAVGGGCVNNNNVPLIFSSICKDKFLREKFIRYLVEFALKHGFDGFDINWEFPGRPKGKNTEHDHENFIRLLQEIRHYIQEKNLSLELSVSIPVGRPLLQEYNLIEMAKCADWLNAMTYNYSGSWSGTIDHHTPLYPDIHKTITYLLHERKIPSKKIVFGLALYGRSFKLGRHNKRKQKKKILGGINAGPGLGTNENGALAFWHIQQLPLSYKEFWDDVSKVPYRFNVKTSEVISYDNEKSLEMKCQYVKQQNLDGVMVWELSKDSRPDWKGISTIHAALHSE